MSDRYASIVSAVAAIIHGPMGRVTFVRQRHGPFAGNWLLPGGGIEIGESPAEAVIREVKEETGLTISNPHLFALYEITGSFCNLPFHIMLFTFYVATDQYVPPRFVGHNVSAIAQSVTAAISLHSTDLRILSDAGVTASSEAAICSALRNDGLIMRTYRLLP